MTAGDIAQEYRLALFAAVDLLEEVRHEPLRLHQLVDGVVFLVVQTELSLNCAEQNQGLVAINY